MISILVSIICNTPKLFQQTKDSQLCQGDRPQVKVLDKSYKWSGRQKATRSSVFKIRWTRRNSQTYFEEANFKYNNTTDDERNKMRS